jgi:hypothetical protein
MHLELAAENKKFSSSKRRLSDNELPIILERESSERLIEGKTNEQA